jgi:hypothetical protein
MKTVSVIKEASSKINLCYTSDGDGRITSAIKEREYLQQLEHEMKQIDPEVLVEHPKDRYWYDVLINHIPINLKISSGGTDNAFNKLAILYTISGSSNYKKNTNYNEWFKTIRECTKKEVRNRETEYHYLVVDKESGSVLFKSILDIHSYKSNPCNILQINWKSEFKEMEYVCPDEKFEEKITELLKTVQRSIIQAIAGMCEFAEADLDTLLVKNTD